MSAQLASVPRDRLIEVNKCLQSIETLTRHRVHTGKLIAIVLLVVVHTNLGPGLQWLHLMICIM